MSQASGLHVPVMLPEVLGALSPKDNAYYLDATFGNGGYSSAILDSANCHLAAIDRDPDAIARGQAKMASYGSRFLLLQGTFGNLSSLIQETDFRQLDGIVFDLGVCSTQLDEAARGFSFMRDGPLDMRMSKSGLSAADIVNDASETKLADIIWRYGEDRASRRIARAIIKARESAPITTTLALADIVRSVLPRPKPGQSDPATRTFQALRIEVNDELREIEDALSAAEAVLKPGGLLVVVSFHSLEDRLVKQFLTPRSGRGARPSRHLPDTIAQPASFELISRKAIAASPQEAASNPRARSAKLRAARRTDAPVWQRDTTANRHQMEA